MFRAPWVLRRLYEIPTYSLFLYNLLLDRNLEWRHKEHPFAALRYLFHDEPLDLIPEDDALLSKVDDLTMVLCCLTELSVFLPAGVLSQGQQVLAADGIDLHKVVAETPKHLGAFFFKLYGIYHELVAKHRKYLGSTMQTEALVQRMQSFLADYHPPLWGTVELGRVEKFLEVFE